MRPLSAALSEFCTIIQGGRHGLSGNNFVPDGYPAYGAGGINGYLETFEFERDAVVLSSIGARCGKCFYASGRWSSLANTQIIIPQEDKADPKFLWFQLNDEARWHRSGTGQPFIKPSDVKAHKVYLPPLPEQRRIAAILDKADALRAKRREALAQLDELTQSIFLEMFGDPVTNPMGWPIEKLENFFQFRTGKLDSNAATTNGAYPFFTCAKENYRIDSYAFDCEALLLSGNNANAEYSVKHFTGKFNAYQRTYVITLKDPSNSYKYSAFFLENHLSILKKLSKGSSTKYLTLGMLNNIRIPVPPPMIQKRFGEQIDIINKSRIGHETSRLELDQFFTTIQNRAFRGEL